MNSSSDLSQSDLRFEEVLENVQQHRDVIVGRQIEIGILEVRFEEVLVARLAQLIGQHHGIHSRPFRKIQTIRGGSKELEHLASMHSDLRNFERAARAHKFLAQQMVAEPVAKQPNGIADGFCFRRNSEAFGTDRFVIGKEGKIPTKLREKGLAHAFE